MTVGVGMAVRVMGGCEGGRVLRVRAMVRVRVEDEGVGVGGGEGEG